MSKRTSLSLSAAVIAALTTCLPALAAETSPSAAVPAAGAPEHAVPKKEAPPPAAPRPAAAEDPYRCHPSQDVSCTVVRETSQGTLIVTMRSKGQSARQPAWIVVSGAPPSTGPHRGGTVYVVPSNDADAQSTAHQVALMPANGAPILD